MIWQQRQQRTKAIKAIKRGRTSTFFVKSVNASFNSTSQRATILSAPANERISVAFFPFLMDFVSNTPDFHVKAFHVLSIGHSGPQLVKVTDATLLSSSDANQ